MKQAIVLAALLAASSLCQAIDCGKAATAAEHRICATPSLLALDRELSAAYAAAQQGGDPDLLRADQRRWLRETRGPCAGKASCLEQAYRQRLALLKRWQQPQPLPASVEGSYPMTRQVPLYEPDAKRWQTESLQDCLHIAAPLSNGELPLRIYSVQTNGHSCEIEGLARRDGDSLLVEQQGSDDEQPCRVRLHFLAQRIRVQAESPACADFCGARASLHGVEYPAPPVPGTVAGCAAR